MSEEENNSRFSAAYLAEEAEAKEHRHWKTAGYNWFSAGHPPPRFEAYKELSAEEVARIARTWAINDNKGEQYSASAASNNPYQVRLKLDAELRRRNDPQATERAGMFEEETPMKKDKDKRTLSSQRNEYIDKTYDEDLNKKEEN
tara:strand:+ start:93 stop:527 length:435 start_codon:yes stop_codon:yes gene_type:complete